MSEMKRMQEDYKQLWMRFKALMDSCCNDTPDNKQINEKQLYQDIKNIMEAMENNDKS